MEGLAEQPVDGRVVRPFQDTELEPIARVKFEHWLGSLGLQDTAEVVEVPEQLPHINVLERLRSAKEGSAEAMQWLDANISTAIFEAVFKENYVGETFMEQNEAGQLVQFGQTNEDIHHNGLVLRPNRHPALQAITVAEAFNRQRLDVGRQAGELRDHYYVVFSLVPNSVPETALGPDGDGYFLDGLSLNIQATTQLPNQQVKTETGFMLGVEADQNDDFEDRLAKRHDFQAVTKLYEWFGQKASQTADGLLHNGLLIPKEMMSNGVVDVMRWLAITGDEVLGRQVDRSVEYFKMLRADSKRREASLKDVHQKVKEDLLFMTDRLTDPMQAVKLMWEFVREHTTEASFTNLNIEPSVLGRIAAPDIIMARYYLEIGQEQLAKEHKQKAHQESVVTGCGGGDGGSHRRSELEKIAGKDDLGSKAFRCPKGHLNIRPERNKTIPRCQHKGCTAKVKC